MKDTVLEDLRVWSVFQSDRRIDFNGFFWRRAKGNVMFDPMPLDGVQERLVEAAGGVDAIVLSNADHWRATSAIADRFGARIAAPAGDRERFEARAGHVTDWFTCAGGLPCALADDLELRWIRGGKSPWEAAFWLRPLRALCFGDAVRSHVCGALRLLPDDKQSDPRQLQADVLALRDLNAQAILLGDGDSLFCGARSAFLEFLRGVGHAR